jgi:hypothetical protein
MKRRSLRLLALEELRFLKCRGSEATLEERGNGCKATVQGVGYRY